MTTRRYARFALAVPVLLTIVAGLPSAAVAAPVDPAKLEAVTELEPDELWVKLTYKVRRGEEVHAPLGVISVDKPPVKGLVVEFRAMDDLEFVRHYRNCWYTTNANADIAWCEFDTVLPGYSGLTIESPVVAAEAQATPEGVTRLPFRWASKRWADDRGGLRKVVDYFKAPGAPVTRGTGELLTLHKRTLPMADIRVPGNFLLLELDESPPTSSPSPSTSPTASPSPRPTATSSSPTAAPTPTPTEPANGAGLPVTGSPAGPVAGLGAALLIAGLAAVLIARRRRGSA
jgi:hypothetical protein